MKCDDPFDLDRLTFRDDQIQERPASVPAKIERRRQHFIKVPWRWMEKLSSASGRTFEVALRLLYMHWKNNGQPIKLANGMLAVDGIPSQSKRRALRDLEHRGLVAVEWRDRKSPIVRVLV
jgi:hypothetical protein